MTNNVKKSYKDKDLKIISFMANFDTSSPNARVVTLSQDGGKLILEFPQTESKKMMDLIEYGRNKTFTIFVDVDNVIDIGGLIEEKIKYLELLKLDTGALREELQAICHDINIKDLTDTQIKAIKLMCIVDKDFEFTDRDIAKYLNVSLSEVRIWNNEVKFRKVKNAMINFVKDNMKGEFIKVLLRKGLLGYEASMKTLASHYGLTETTPSSVTEINILQNEQNDDPDFIRNRVNRLYPQKKE